MLIIVLPIFRIHSIYVWLSYYWMLINKLNIFNFMYVLLIYFRGTAKMSLTLTLSSRVSRSIWLQQTRLSSLISPKTFLMVSPISILSLCNISNCWLKILHLLFDVVYLNYLLFINEIIKMKKFFLFQCCQRIKRYRQVWDRY